MNPRLQLYRNLPRYNARSASALTIGNFDGVHRGHQAILDQVVEYGQKHALVPTVMTFSPHPRAFFAQKGHRPELIPTQISSLRDKATWLADHGIRQLVVLRFNQALADMAAEDFVRELLLAGLNTRWLLVGEDFRFGHKRQGDIALLRRLAARHAFAIETVSDVSDPQGQRISSSALRTALAVGDLARSRNLLGRPYRISGHVIYGQQLGHQLGFPTLNVGVTAPCAARSGVYVVRVHGLGATPWPGVASLGVRPTVACNGRLLLEVHLLDRTVNAYGKLVCVEFLEFLRDEESFPDLPSLTAAIRKDVRDARHYLASHGL